MKLYVIVCSVEKVDKRETPWKDNDNAYRLPFSMKT